MAYYCLKCKRKHHRGQVFETHQIYQEKYSLEITEVMKQDFNYYGSYRSFVANKKIRKRIIISEVR